MRNREVIMTIARLASAHPVDTIPKGSAQFVLGEAVVALPLGDVIDFAKERARLEKELKKASTKSPAWTPSSATSYSCRGRRKTCSQSSARRGRTQWRWRRD